MLSDILSKWGAVIETPMQFYTDIFRLGSGLIQSEWEPPGVFKSNPLILGYSHGRVHRKIMFEDTFEATLVEFCGYDWAFLSGCSYFGRKNSADRQGRLFTLIFDIDGVTDSTLNNFLSGAIVGAAYPVPQHIVLSGHGIHLYYVFDDPIVLRPAVKTQMKNLKYALTCKLWNSYTSTEDHIQYQGINQAFRVPGSRTKPGAELPIVTAYRLATHPTSVTELNEYVDDWFRADTNIATSRLTLEAAKAEYPEWYERVVLNGERSQWVVKPDLYRWWLHRISSGATYHHRYFCVMMLAIYAAKCGIYDAEKVRADVMELMPFFNSLNPDEPFTEADVDSALECLDSRYTRFPRSEIEKLSNIPIPANKRNGRKQQQHIKIMSAIRDIDHPDGSWRNKSGAPTKADLIRQYAAEHPEANHSEIARALDVSRPTVIKWLRTPQEPL